jgi:hypothetical protein
MMRINDEPAVFNHIISLCLGDAKEFVLTSEDGAE